MESKPLYGAGLKALEEGKYKYFRQTDINKTPKMYVNKTCNRIMKRGDFFISRAGTIETYYHNNEEEYVYAGYLIKYPINKKIAISKYIYYWSKGIGYSQIKSLSKTGCTMPKLNPAIAKQIEISIPSLKIQKQIIGIIEPIEKIENEINRLERNMSKAIQFCINDILGEEEIELSSILKIQSSVQEGLISYGIGREGLFKNSSKANKLKKVGFFNICIGYVRNDHLDIGINRTIKNLGVSSAYKVIELAQGPLLAYFVYSFIKDNYLRLSLQSARGTGSISIKSLLKESIYINSKNLNKKASHFKNLILYTEKIYRIKTKISKLKFQLINNLTSYSSLNGIDN